MTVGRTARRTPQISRGLAIRYDIVYLTISGPNHYATLCVGVTMLLSLSVLQVVVSEKLPTTSDTVSVISKSNYYC